MTRGDILAELKTGEDSTVEFKTADVHFEEVGDELVATLWGTQKPR